MTREEKISHLKGILSEINENDNAVCYLTSEDNELIESTIEALEQQSCENAISRDDALKALDYDIKSFEFKSGVGKHMNEIANLLNTIYEIQSDNIKALPPVQPKYNTSEWCHDCSEYDQNKHCCPRYNNVIRNAVEEMKQPCEDAISRTDAILALDEIFDSVPMELTTEILGLRTVLRKKLPSVQPQPKTGQWVLLDECSNSGYYCSYCHKKLVKEGWSGTVKKIKFCPNCGAKLVKPQESEEL